MDLDHHDATRCVLITGVLGGIGSEVAQMYHQAGFFVIGCDLKKFQGTEEEKLARGIDRYIAVDLADLEQVRSMCQEVINLLDHINRSFAKSGDGIVILTSVIHVAAYQFCGMIFDSTSRGPSNSDLPDLPDSTDSVSSLDSGYDSGMVLGPSPGFNDVEWTRIMNVNLRSIYQINQMLLPLLKLWKGSIVVVGSVHSVASSAGISMYAISKSALVGLVRNSAIEFGPLGVRINLVSPGAIQTPMLMAGLARGGGDISENFAKLSRRHLNGRVGQPNEIAKIIRFLSDSSQSGLINGQNIVADGGVSCVLSTETD